MQALPCRRCDCDCAGRIQIQTGQCLGFRVLDGRGDKSKSQWHESQWKLSLAAPLSASFRLCLAIFSLIKGLP